MKIFQLVCLFLVSFLSFGQNKLENSIRLFDKAKDYFNKKLLILSFFSLISSIAIGQNPSFKKDSLKIDALTKKASSFINTSSDSVFYYFNLAERITKKSENKILLSGLYLKIGNFYYNKFQDKKAMAYYLKSDSILDFYKIQNKTSFANLINISRLVSYSADIKKDSLYYFKVEAYILKALKVAEEIKYNTGLAIGFNEYAKLYSINGNHKKALEFHKKALNFVNDDDKVIKSSLYWGIASSYLNLNKVDSAEYYYKKRISLFEKTNQPKELALAYSGLGGFYNRIKKPKKGIYFQLKALKMFDTLKLSNSGKILGTMNGLATAYANDNQYKNAYTMLDKAYLFKDSLTSLENSNLTLELEKKYQTQKKEQEIKLLKTQNQLTEHQKLNQRNVMLGGLALTSLAGLFLFVMYRNRQKTTTKLKELDKAKSNFFANISHEFRTPLTLISAPIQEALQDDSLTEKKRNQFEMAQRNSERLLSLVNQVLELSKIDSGDLKLQIEEGHILQFISALSDSFSFSAEQNGILFKNDIETDIDKSWFDKDAIEKIVINLLSNAIKYTPKNGSVVCKATVKEGKLHFEIKNTGTGLTKDELNAVFKRFYQTDEQNQGSGIGLSLVKELVELYKGQITVSSEPDNWTTFIVTLPINKNDFNKEQFSLNPKGNTSVSRTEILNSKYEDDDEFSDSEQPILLIVEDNADLRTLVKQYFEASYNVLTAPNGKRGIELAIKHIPDLIISDVMMPVKDGIALTKELKNNECTAHIPIILLTAKVDLESQFEGIDIGADDYITKPFDKKLLGLKVKKLIESRKKLQLRYSQELILMPKDIAVTDLDEKFLEKVQVILDQKLIESSFNIEAFSKAVGMSRMQLHRKLKALTGLSASEFIRSQRLKLAAQLLKSSTINISQVGYSVGFNDHSYFDKCFKETYNSTPTEYSKRKDF